MACVFLLANNNARSERGGVDNCHREIVELDSSAFIGQFKRKPLESCEKMSKINQKLYQVATVRRAAL